MTNSEDWGEVFGPLERELNRRAALPFDGVMGTLPEWVPENFHTKFEFLRDRLLKKYSHQALLDALDAGEAAAKETRGMLTGRPLDITDSVFKFSEVKGVADGSFLVRLRRAVGLGEIDGLALLTDPALANEVKFGKTYRLHQSKAAKKPRGMKGDNAETPQQLICKLILQPDHKEKSAKELWPLFLGEMDCAGFEIAEFTNDSGDLAVFYEVAGRQKTLSLGRFKNIVSECRKEKK